MHATLVWVPAICLTVLSVSGKNENKPASNVAGKGRTPPRDDHPGWKHRLLHRERSEPEQPKHDAKNSGSGKSKLIDDLATGLFESPMRSYREAGSKMLEDFRERADNEMEAVAKRWLNEDNLKAAMDQYSRMQDNPLFTRLLKSVDVGARASKMIKAKIPPLALEMAEMALNVTVEITLDHVQDPAHSNHTRWESMEDLIKLVEVVDMDLQKWVDGETFRNRSELMQAVAGRDLRVVVTKADRAKVAAIIRAKAVPRVMLPCIAATLHGMDPRNDPLLNALIISYACGQMSQELATSALNMFEHAMLDVDVNARQASQPEQQQKKKKTKQKMHTQLDGLLDASHASCGELGQSSFMFFSTVASVLGKTGSAADLKRSDHLSKTGRVVLKLLRHMDPGKAHKQHHKGYMVGGMYVLVPEGEAEGQGTVSVQKGGKSFRKIHLPFRHRPPAGGPGDLAKIGGSADAEEGDVSGAEGQELVLDLSPSTDGGQSDGEQCMDNSEEEHFWSNLTVYPEGSAGAGEGGGHAKE